MVGDPLLLNHVILELLLLVSVVKKQCSSSVILKCIYYLLLTIAMCCRMSMYNVVARKPSLCSLSDTRVVEAGTRSCQSKQQPCIL